MNRVLWICNIMLPAVARELGLPFSNREGWLSGIFQQLVREKENQKIELGICFPVDDLKEYTALKGKEAFFVKGVPCYVFLENLECPEQYDPAMESRFTEIYRDFQPDMIHVFGTEFPHALAAVKAFGRREKTLIGIQGLCYEIAKVYMAGLPEKIQRNVTFRDFVKKDSLKQQQEKFYLRGKNEIEAISLAGHITGRTGFDREGTERINKTAVYHHMNETMRSSFYEGQWNPETCEKHSIFLGQGDYPLKGFHFLLQAMPEIVKKYPDAVLYVAGNSVISHATLKEKIKLPAYGKYLLGLIRQYNLEDKVVVLGRLSEEEMKQRFLKSHVFVCASVLENSPNTVGEAMLLGVPVAASNAGGIPDMLTDGVEGLLFEAGNPGAIASAVTAVFDEGEDQKGNTLALRLSKAAGKRAKTAHNGETNYRRLLEIYGSILGA